MVGHGVTMRNPICLYIAADCLRRRLFEKRWWGRHADRSLSAPPSTLRWLAPFSPDGQMTVVRDSCAADLPRLRTRSTTVIGLGVLCRRARLVLGQIGNGEMAVEVMKPVKNFRPSPISSSFHHGCMGMSQEPVGHTMNMLHQL